MCFTKHAKIMHNFVCHSLWQGDLGLSRGRYGTFWATFSEMPVKCLPTGLLEIRNSQLFISTNTSLFPEYRSRLTSLTVDTGFPKRTVAFQASTLWAAYRTRYTGIVIITGGTEVGTVQSCPVSRANTEKGGTLLHTCPTILTQGVVSWHTLIVVWLTHTPSSLHCPFCIWIWNVFGCCQLNERIPVCPLSKSYGQAINGPL